VFLKINSLKNLITILLLTCLTLPFIGSVSWLNYQKKKVKRQVKHQIIAGIDKEDLVLLTFSLDNAENKLKWKHSKEFEYNGSMYDIVEADTSGNNINYWCWWDYEETKLNKQLTKLLAQYLSNNTENKAAKNQLNKFFDTLFYLKNNPWKTAIIIHQKNLFNLYLNNYESLNISPSSPPPIYS